MRARSKSKRRSNCPLNVTLETVGDGWSLLVVRDLMFKDRTTFNEFLDGGEGIATNVLADRLQRLESHGIIARHPDERDGRKVQYGLTRKGIDLAPALVELILWAARYEQTDAPPAAVREMMSHRERFLAGIRERWANRTKPRTAERL